MQKIRALRVIDFLKDGGTPWDKLSFTDKRNYIVNYLTAAGYTKPQAAAIVGNLIQENDSFDTTNTNRIGAFGIAQWLGDRKTALMKRPDPYSIDTQLAHLDSEIRGSGWNNYKDLKNTFFSGNDVAQLTYAFRKGFERPGEYEANDKRRLAEAQKIMSSSDGVSPTVAQTSSFQPLQNAAATQMYDLDSLKFYMKQDPKIMPHILNPGNQEWFLENQKLSEELAQQKLLKEQSDQENAQLEQMNLEKQAQRQQVLSMIPKATAIDSSNYGKPQTFADGGMLKDTVPDIQGFYQELIQIIPDVVVISGRRYKPIGKLGNASRHRSGEAMDLRVNPRLQKFLYSGEGDALLRKYGLGFLDESIGANLKSTRGTGPHYHIGKDTTLSGNQYKGNTAMERIRSNGTTSQMQPAIMTPQTESNQWSFPITDSDSYIPVPFDFSSESTQKYFEDQLKAENEALKQQQLEQQQEAENLQIQQLLAQKQAERQQILSMIPKATAVPLYTTQKPSTF